MHTKLVCETHVKELYTILFCTFLFQVSDENDAVVFIATPAVSSHTIINTGNPESLVSADHQDTSY